MTDKPSADMIVTILLKFLLQSQNLLQFPHFLMQVGKQHLANDGFHVDYSYSYLTAQSLAAAVLDVDPYKMFDQPHLL